MITGYEYKMHSEERGDGHNYRILIRFVYFWVINGAWRNKSGWLPDLGYATSLLDSLRRTSAPLPSFRISVAEAWACVLLLFSWAMFMLSIFLWHDSRAAVGSAVGMVIAVDLLKSRMSRE